MRIGQSSCTMIAALAVLTAMVPLTGATFLRAPSSAAALRHTRRAGSSRGPSPPCVFMQTDGEDEGTFNPVALEFAALDSHITALGEPKSDLEIKQQSVIMHVVRRLRLEEEVCGIYLAETRSLDLQVSLAKRNALAHPQIYAKEEEYVRAVQFGNGASAWGELQVGKAELEEELHELQQGEREVMEAPHRASQKQTEVPRPRLRLACACMGTHIHYTSTARHGLRRVGMCKGM